MGFWTLFQVASVPNLQVLLISMVGASLASKHCNLLTENARKSLNKIVFMVFTPSLMFAGLAKTVTFEDIISWWFMPVNIALTFLVGWILGWIVVKLVKPSPHLEGLVIAVSSSGNLGNLMLIIVPAICKEDGSPFGDKGICSTVGLSYASFSMALGGFFVWTYTFQLIRSSCTKYKELQAEGNRSNVPNSDFNVNTEAPLLKGEDQGKTPDSDKAKKPIEDVESQAELNSQAKWESSIFGKIGGCLHQILEELMAPPTMAAVGVSSALQHDSIPLVNMGRKI